MSVEAKQKIKDSLSSFSQGNLTQNSLRFFEALGYDTDRQAHLNKPVYAEFKDAYVKANSRFNEKKALTDEWKSVDLLFQLSQEEISKQVSLFDTKRVDRTIIETYLFFAIELTDTAYSRTALSQITREINKLFPMPVMVLFKTGGQLTLSVINRRLHKRDESKDVLEKVTLIKDISIDAPHRAHVEILFDLSFNTLLEQYKFTNFVELHEAWRKTLDIKELNKRFYQELSNWYFWAMDNVSFPDDAQKDKDIRNSIGLIRLITRVIFVWFIKEKELIPEKIFQETEIKRLLKEFKRRESSNSYYTAILQNLFFGTLNQKMSERGFAKEGSFNDHKKEYGIKNLFRYADLFAISEKEVLSLFKEVPFLNGGLFDCLDKENDEKKVIYIDGFSRNPNKRADVPDFLFFAEEQDADLNETYGTKNKRYRVKGLIDTLSAYKFTVAENTPIEEEVALDPELLGRVFENLLASYNQETQTTARKQTGSFYTPREIVNYMVDESLKAYLKQALLEKAKIKEEDADAGLEILFSYTEREHAFSDAERKALIEAIDTCKILDPACGSGAFPMGILHKLVHILHKLDPDNKLWRDHQRQKAIKETEETFKLGDKSEREHRLIEINDVFENNSDDYGRKLFLIENCIFGIDIQPIAVQIAKLRFFISLVVDQKRQEGKENLGIRSLPNLETKFVAANTLIGLEKPKDQMNLFENKEITAAEDKLKELRHRYFSAKTRKEKLAYQDEDDVLRKKIAKLLERDGWSHDTAKQIVAFDPYNQNASSPFFDAEWMFGLREAKAGEGVFNVVIGNPPYVRADSGEEYVKFRKRLEKSDRYETLWEKWDLYIAFIELSYKLLAPFGITSMIVSDAYCHSKYAEKSQKWFLKNSRIICLDFLSDIKVFEAGIRNLVYLFQKANGDSWKPKRRRHINDFGEIELLPTNEQQKLTYRMFFPDNNKNGFVINIETNRLDEICYISVGMVIHANEKIAHGAFLTSDLISKYKDNMHPKAFVEGKDLSKWYFPTHSFLEWGTKRAPALFRRQTFEELYSVPEKIMLPMVGDIRAAYDNEKLMCNHGIFVCVPWHYLHGVRNRSLSKAASYKDEKKCEMPSREKLEEYSKGISAKYLLAIANSSVAKYFLKTNRRNNIQLYPDDWKALPIPKPKYEEQQELINKVIDYILFISKCEDIIKKYFEALIDSIVYELYFPSELHAANCEVLKHLSDLPALHDDWSDEKKLKTIEKVHKELSHPSHLVSIAMEKMKNRSSVLSVCHKAG